MAPFIGKSDGKHQVSFSKGEIPNCYLEIEFKLTEAEGHIADDSGDEEVKEQAHVSSRDSKKYEDDLKDLRDQIAELKKETSNL